MKRVVMLVPDTIRFTLGGSSSSRTREVPISGEVVTNALEVVDYHEHYSFAAGSVVVERIEEANSIPDAPTREESREAESLITG